MVVDAHAHIGQTPYARQAVEDVLATMDQNEVDRTVLCAMGAHLVVHNREGNDFIADAIAAHPDRLIGFASVNPWYGAAALEELERATVGRGLAGLKLHPPMQGFEADDDVVLPVLEKAIELGLPIYIHSGTPVASLPLQVLELATRYPDGKFILGHMGGADFYVDVPLSFGRVANVWVETSLTCHAGYVAEAVARLGAERVLFGSDSPTSAVATELCKIRVLNLPHDETRRVLGENMRALLESTGGWR